MIDSAPAENPGRLQMTVSRRSEENQEKNKSMNIALWYGLLMVTLAAPISGQSPATTPSPVTANHQARAPFAAEIATFEAADKQSPPPPGGIVFVGSSSIRFWTTLAQDFPELPVINRGFGGSQIVDSVRYADRIVLPYKPKMIVLYAGTNDVDAGKLPEQVLKDFQTFADKVHRKLPEMRLVYLAINPSVARWSQEAKALEVNHLIEHFIMHTASKARKLSFLNAHQQLLDAQGKPRPAILRADGLHLNAKGYQEWTAILKPQLMALWKSDTK